MKKTPGSVDRRGLLKSAGLVSVQGLFGTPLSAGIVDAARIRKKAHDYYQPLSEKSAPASGSYFDILVIGSGYGSAIFSSRVSDELSPHSSLAILERGKEWFPGDFPETMTDYLSEIRSHENSYLDTLLRKLKVPEALSWTLKGLENQLGLLDFYEFDEKQMRVIGRKNKKIITLGDRLNVLVAKTDIDRRTIDLELVNE